MENTIRAGGAERIMLVEDMLAAVRALSREDSYAYSYQVWIRWKMARALLQRTKGRRDRWQGRNDDPAKLIADIQGWLVEAKAKESRPLPPVANVNESP